MSSYYKILVVIFIFMLETALYGQTNVINTSFHKTGLYEYIGENPGYLIKRTKNRQIEYNKETKQKLVFKISWILDNEYELEFIRHHNFPGCLRKGYIINTIIVESNPERYTCEWKTQYCGNGIVKFKKIK